MELCAPVSQFWKRNEEIFHIAVVCTEKKKNLVHTAATQPGVRDDAAILHKQKMNRVAALQE